ncbi:MAG: sulfotransferase domain-containing protein [Chloroflexota bacterium]
MTPKQDSPGLPDRQTMLKNLYRTYSILTSPLRTMPDFLMIGAHKGGSTSFYDYIVQHPQVLRIYKKAPKYFDHNYHQPELWYRSHFPPVWKRREGNTMVGEASQDTIFHPQAPKRVFELVPQVKLIVLLRNPVDRAYSHYHHLKRLGQETVSFEEVLKLEPGRLGNVIEELSQNKDSDMHHFMNHSYMARGLYVEQLERWFEYFPREQFFIDTSENFYADTAGVYQKIIKFLGLPEWLPANFKNSNPGGYQPMKPETRQQLEAYYQPYNQKLYGLLGKDFGW